ncbi:butyrophilin subfamily 2 member A2-like isoform X2 [Dasypus novemcinctus]|uniref:butyrophilin subfamily 2 member A2-like isoform X2 n=1 Tax=Dasypus novemcinctus TaxID=9361 RepID=UPI0026600913|nr:butyrophilin subfamily 2 member A2-like isoform X1 [Dasypus novemcinctus]XP_058141351.1 butyrophilin subfamily 2 member A2-like isoform X1 [Dasypus novemcinctus]
MLPGGPGPVLMEPAASLRVSPQGGLLFLLFLSAFGQLSAQFTVVGPPEPVLAMVGESSTLRCHLSPEKSAEAMEVRWFRTHFSPAVLVYRGGRERPEEQMQQYCGRTSLEGAGLGRGHAVLVIHNVTAHEDGDYRCYFQEGRSYDQAIVRLEVAGLGSKPLVEMKGQEDGGIRLECTSAGWYPQPHAVWRDPYGEVVPALEEAYTAGVDGLFTVTLAVIVRDYSVRNMSCSINNTRLSRAVEAGIFIPESFMPSTSPWMVALAVILPTLILLMAGGICLVKKFQKEKEVESEEKEIAQKKLGKELVAKEKERQIKEQLQELRWRRTLLHAADVVLDPATAHPELCLSEDRRTVFRGTRRQEAPNNPERFDLWPCVLGLERFSSGRHYWEVEVEDVMAWAVGVCGADLPRKGEVAAGGSVWALELFGGQYRPLAAPALLLPLRERLGRVGVFLDYEAGDVSFYNMRDRSHIYTCPRSAFAGPLRPFFRLGSDDSPLAVCPAFVGAQGVMVPEAGLVLHGVGARRGR